MGGNCKTLGCSSDIHNSMSNSVFILSLLPFTLFDSLFCDSLYRPSKDKNCLHNTPCKYVSLPLAVVKPVADEAHKDPVFLLIRAVLTEADRSWWIHLDFIETFIETLLLFVLGVLAEIEKRLEMKSWFGDRLWATEQWRFRWYESHPLCNKRTTKAVSWLNFAAWWCKRTRAID